MNDEHPRWATLDELRQRRSYKWRAHPPDVLPSFVAEMDVTLAAPIARALHDAIAGSDTGYALPDPELSAAAAGFLQARFGWGPDPGSVTLVSDVMSAVDEIIRRALPRGSGVVVNTPVYPPFFSHIREAGCRVVAAPLARAGQGYVVDLEAVERGLAGGAAAYLLCNPHNPTGLVLSARELGTIAELAERYGALVLADEIHAPLMLGGARHVPYLSLPQAQPRGIALVSATKAWNLPGLKCAQVVHASESMGRVVAQLPEELFYRASNLGVIASIAAYREGAAWLDELLVLLDRSRRLLAELLAQRLPEVGYLPPHGTYMGWLDCRRMGLSGEPADVFLERGRVALRRGPDFGAGGEGWARLTLATAPEILEEIVERMRVAASAQSGRPCSR